MGTEPQARAVKDIHRIAAPGGGRHQNQPRHARALADDRLDGDGRAQAVAEKVDGSLGVTTAKGGDEVGRVARQRRRARPDAGLWRLAEPALVDRVGEDAPRRPVPRRGLEGMAVIVEAVKRGDHRPGSGVTARRLALTPDP